MAVRNVLYDEIHTVWDEYFFFRAIRRHIHVVVELILLPFDNEQSFDHSFFFIAVSETFSWFLVKGGRRASKQWHRDRLSFFPQVISVLHIMLMNLAFEISKLFKETQSHPCASVKNTPIFKSFPDWKRSLVRCCSQNSIQNSGVRTKGWNSWDVSVSLSCEHHGLDEPLNWINP